MLAQAILQHVIRKCLASIGMSRRWCGAVHVSCLFSHPHCTFSYSLRIPRRRATAQQTSALASPVH
eukprot:1293211-Pyramimonas_sp.AAC.1